MDSTGPDFQDNCGIWHQDRQKWPTEMASERSQREFKHPLAPINISPSCTASVAVVV
jgi:hypothetical protein